MNLNLILLFACCGLQLAFAYKIPDVKLELLSTGFRVSIPDDAGVRYVAFNINRNRKFKGFEPGEFSVQITTPTNNRWIYENTQKNLKTDDVIYIWVNVQHQQLIYRSISDPISIERLQITNNSNGNEGITTSTTSTPINFPVDKTEENFNFDIRKDGDDCEKSISKVQNRNVCKGELLFEENFEEGLNSSRWQYEVRVALDVDDAEFVLYDNEVENIHVANSILTIQPTLWNNDRSGTDIKQGTLDLGLRCTSKQNLPQECRRQPEGFAYDIIPPIKSARINTKNSFSFKYGRVDIRAKIPYGDWIFPLMLLEPLKNNYGPASFASGQLRIAFARGNDNLQTADGERIDGRTLYGGAVLCAESSLREKFLVNIRRNTHLANDFHIYTMIWTNEKLVFQIDGLEYGTIEGGFANKVPLEFEHRNVWKSGEFMSPFDQEFYLTLGVSVGGHGDFPDGSISNNRKKPWMNTSPKAASKFWKDRHHWKTTWKKPEMLIDFVRVYAI